MFLNNEGQLPILFSLIKKPHKLIVTIAVRKPTMERAFVKAC